VRENIIKLKVDTGNYQSFIDRIIALGRAGDSHYVCVANVHMLIEGYLDNMFADAVNGADITAPDGMPLTWAMRMLYGVKQDRVAGMDLLPDLLDQCANSSIPVFFYGSTDTVLSNAKAILNSKYPDLKIAGMYSPPFRVLNSDEENEVVDMINNSDAKLVFVILGCPKQEKWMASMKGKINATMVGVGGALPVLLGMQQRAPKWMQKSGFEWLYRLKQEPKRLFKRYFVTNTLFSYLLLREYLAKKFLKGPYYN
jgi:N-acetylglucosaminyldiphosphoundecaprenol N-acetyl-beta-D-mannosaminyltransferase